MSPPREEAAGAGGKPGEPQSKIKRLTITELRLRESTPTRTFSQRRLMELRMLIHHRHGQEAPETDDASIYVEFAAIHIVGAPEDIRKRLTSWASLHAPSVPAPEVRRIAERQIRRPVRLRAATAGRFLGVTLGERDVLGLRTIAASDLTAEERLELAAFRKKRNDAERARAKRRAAGAKPRLEYESMSAESTKPWEAAGVSRATWYRRHARPLGAQTVCQAASTDQSRQSETGPSRIYKDNRYATHLSQLDHEGSRPNVMRRLANILADPVIARQVLKQFRSFHPRRCA